MYSVMSMRTMLLLVVEQRLRPAPWPARSCPRRWGRGTGTSRWAGSGPGCPRGSAGWPRLTLSTASSWPMTRSCRMSARCSSFSRSPSISLVTGMPVQRADDPGDFLVGHLVAQQACWPFCRLRRCALPPRPAAFCSCGQRAVFAARRPCSGRTRARAFSISALTCSISSRSFCTLPMAFFSFSHWAFISLNWSRSSASSFWISARCSLRELVASPSSARPPRFRAA